MSNEKQDIYGETREFSKLYDPKQLIPSKLAAQYADAYFFLGTWDVFFRQESYYTLQVMALNYSALIHQNRDEMKMDKEKYRDKLACFGENGPMTENYAEITFAHAYCHLEKAIKEGRFKPFTITPHMVPADQFLDIMYEVDIENIERVKTGLLPKYELLKERDMTEKVERDFAKNTPAQSYDL